MATAPAPNPAIDPKTGQPYHRLNFPPFPPLLPGETLPSFDDYLASKPVCGIRVPLSEEFLDDDEYIERDAHGVPTVPLLKVHDTDEKPRKRKLKAAPVVTAAEPLVPPDPEGYIKFGWEVQWDAMEQYKQNVYDP